MSTNDEMPTNWGRWGADDERGTLNLITDDVRAKAAAEVRSGRSVSLSRPIPTAPLIAGPMAGLPAASTSALQVAIQTAAPGRVLAELFIIVPHSPLVTHFDSVAHQVIDGRVYPGRPLADCLSGAGIQHGSTAVFADGVVTRGVLLDLAPGGALIAGHGVTGDDLDAAAERGGVDVRAGDAIVVRSGWDEAAARGQHLPGMTLDAVRWMHRHDVAVYVGDVADAHPPIDPTQPPPLHRVGLALLGMPLVDVADPTELVQACAQEGRNSFLFVAAPIRLEAATGVPVNPLAIF